MPVAPVVGGHVLVADGKAESVPQPPGNAALSSGDGLGKAEGKEQPGHNRNHLVFCCLSQASARVVKSWPVRVRRAVFARAIP